MASDSDYLADPGGIPTKLGKPGIAARRAVFKVVAPHFEQARLRTAAVDARVDASYDRIDGLEAAVAALREIVGAQEDRITADAARIDELVDEDRITADAARIDELVGTIEQLRADLVASTTRADAAVDEARAGVLELRATNRRLDFLEESVSASASTTAVPTAE